MDIYINGKRCDRITAISVTMTPVEAEPHAFKPICMSREISGSVELTTCDMHQMVRPALSSPEAIEGVSDLSVGDVLREP